MAVSLSIAAPLYAAINFDNPKNNDIKEEISGLEISAPAPSQAAEAKADKEWTIMVYVNGKNNLERFAMSDMNEMEKIGSTDKINIVTEVGRINGYDTSDGDWVGTRRYLVQKDNDTGKIGSPVVQDLGKVDMGDYKHMAEFANWAKTKYPAKKYMFVAWNHGSGWVKSMDMVTKGISYDDETNNHITTPQLGMALQSMGKVDVYGSDACLMQMPEVNYEIRKSVDYIVGSEETEPGDGYTYDLLLGPLAKNPGMSAKDLGKLAVDAYSDHYQSVSQDSTQSLIDSGAMDAFLGLLNEFAASAMASGEKTQVKSALGSAQSFAYRDNKDLWHFLNLYAASSGNADVKAKISKLQEFLLGNLVLHNRVNGKFANGNTKGLAIYMPASSFNSAYKNLSWASASKWDEFINWYLAKDGLLSF